MRHRVTVIVLCVRARVCVCVTVPVRPQQYDSSFPISRPHHFYNFQILFIGMSLREPHINSIAMRAIYGTCMYVCMYVCMVRPSSARRFIDSIQCRMQSFVLKSLHSKITVTACSNLAHLCNISLVVLRLIKDQRLACREIRIWPEQQQQHRTVPVRPQAN